MRAGEVAQALGEPDVRGRVEITQAGPAEPFEPMVEALIAAGARRIGGRSFEVRPPLSRQQVTALHRLAHLDPGIGVTVDPGSDQQLPAVGSVQPRTRQIEAPR